VTPGSGQVRVAIPPSASYYVLPATITDGGLGDDDLAANGTIVDQGGPGVPLGGGENIPALFGMDAGAAGTAARARYSPSSQ
jgi:hypothetical protein